jgi:hypothetical protein
VITFFECTVTSNLFLLNSNINRVMKMREYTLSVLIITISNSNHFNRDTEIANTIAEVDHYYTSNKQTNKQTKVNITHGMISHN